MTHPFVSSLMTNDLVGENKMPTNSTSGSSVVDLFFRMGAARNIDLVPTLRLAYHEDPLLTTKAIFHNRDVRGGQGERDSFRRMFRWLCDNDPAVAAKNIHNVPFYGRWDDLISAVGTSVEKYAIHEISKGLLSYDMLCAKWMPREGKRNFKTLGKLIMGYMELTPRQYRKLLAGNTAVVESIMCKKWWDRIDYNKVPSVASFKYRKAFARNDPARYSAWLASLSNPESGNKIHADAIFPHSIVGGYIRGWYVEKNVSENPTLEAQWKALPDFVPDGESFIPVCDLSGSMEGIPMLVSASLGIYLSERNKGPFKNAFITFSHVPRLQYVTGSLLDRLVKMDLGSIAQNTDLEAVFRLILTSAVRDNLAPEDMPRNILILSDMQFDSCGCDPGNNAMQMIRRMYSEAGYKVPNVIFWNLKTSTGIPVKITDTGTALVSGFSPSIMKNLLGGEINPLKIVLSTLLSERYSRVVI